jgi:hypothetical protein
MYKLARDKFTGEVTIVNKQVGDILYSIPFNPDNTDYQEYLKWVAEGGVPEPADQPE